MKTTIINRTLLTAAIAFLPFSSSAALLDLAEQPLFLGQTVSPNVFFALDDSGSMDWEIMLPPYYISCSYNNNSPGASGSYDCIGGNGLITTGTWLVNRRTSGSYDYFEYIYSTNDNAYTTGCFTTRESLEDCIDNQNPSDNPSSTTRSLLTADWRIVSSSLNKIFYNPDTNYMPWVLGECLTDGTACSGEQASFTAARSDPRQGNSGYTITYDLSQDTNATSGSEFFPATYDVWTDNAGFDASDGKPRRGTNNNYEATPNDVVDLWDQHTRVVIKSLSVDVSVFTYAPDTTDINETKTTNTITFTDANDDTTCYNALGTQALVKQIQSGDLTYNSTDGEGCRTLKAAKDNFANWFQYHRRRAMVAKAAISEVINDKPNFHYGLNTINDNLFVEVPETSATDVSSHNLSLLETLFTFDWPASGTPLRRGLEKAGKYFDGVLSGVDDPIGNSCQQNFTLLLTDGFWGGSSPSSSIGNADGDSYRITVADVAKYYYDRDLSPLANDIVPTAVDPATHQHMVTFGVAFGVTGDLVDTDGDGWPNPPLEEDDNWGSNPFWYNAAKIDDLWHASYNSKGTFVSADTPSTIVSALSEALSAISERVGSSASVAESSSIVTTDTRVYQGLFNSDGWTGQLLAFRVNADGSIETTPEWDAGCVLTGGSCDSPSGTNTGIAATDRVIITKQSGGDGIPFRVPVDYSSPDGDSELASTQLADLLANAPYSLTTTDSTEKAANQAYAANLINYLRGDQSNEAAQVGSSGFRDREKILGDLVHSSPVYVGPPSLTYSDTLESAAYSTFKAAHASRTPMVYVGANDGMLHAFRADTGAELMAYIPNAGKIYENLPTLSYTEDNTSPSTPYAHKYFVDDTVSVSDAFVDGAWMTLLAGGLGVGGQGIYALDVTDVTDFTEANAEDLVLFEFTDADDPDLGYTIGQPVITKVRAGANDATKWALIFASGYNNSESDGNASTTGKAALYILFIDGGLDGTWTADTDYIKIVVGTGSTGTPNGLASPAVITTDGDIVADFAYAGDIQGNMWKFDLTNTTPTNWKTAATTIFSATDSNGTAQPITAKPVVGPHPSSSTGVGIVYFGTGQYLENDDNTTTGQTTQSLYAVWDKGSTVLRSDMQAQSITAEFDQAFDTDGDGNTDSTSSVRLTSDTYVDWSTKDGWYMDLIVNGSSSNGGERSVSEPLLRLGRVIFTTLIPSTQVCEFGGSSWIMELDATNGGTNDESPFDLNKDGDFDDEDKVYYDIDGDGDLDAVVVSGTKSTVGITEQPTVLLSEDKTKEFKILSGSSGLTSVTENPNRDKLGRQNWRQIWK